MGVDVILYKADLCNLSITQIRTLRATKDFYWDGNRRRSRTTRYDVVVDAHDDAKIVLMKHCQSKIDYHASQVNEWTEKLRKVEEADK